MSDLPEGVPESIFFEHADGSVVELMGYRRQPDLSFGVAPRKKRKKPPGGYRRMRPALLERDGDLCHYCKVKMILPTNNEGHNNRLGPKMCTIEHIVPVTSGGPNAMGNLVLACKKCNNKFGSEYFKCGCLFCESARLRFGKEKRYETQK